MQTVISKYWSLNVSPSSPKRYTPAKNIRLTNVALRASLKDESPTSRTSLRVSAHGMQSDICSLTPTKIEQAVVDIVFVKGTKFIFEIVGHNDLSLSGYEFHDNIMSNARQDNTQEINHEDRSATQSENVVEAVPKDLIPRDQVATPTTIAQVHEEAAKQRAQAEKEVAIRTLTMPRDGSRRSGGPARGQQAGGWPVASGPTPRLPPTTGDLSSFGKVIAGPSSVWAGKKDATKTGSKPSRSSSTRTIVDIGAGAGAVKPQRRKLQLLPRSKHIKEDKVSDVSSGDEAPRTTSEDKANEKITEDIKEFFAVRNIDESEEYFSRLPLEYHHRLVNKMVSKAVESKEADGKLVADAFARATEKKLCSISAFEEGFLPVVELLDDIVIDVPKAFQIMATMMKGAGLHKDQERRTRIVQKSVDSHTLDDLLSCYQALFPAQIIPFVLNIISLLSLFYSSPSLRLSSLFFLLPCDCLCRLSLRFVMFF